MLASGSHLKWVWWIVVPLLASACSDTTSGETGKDELQSPMVDVDKPVDSLTNADIWRVLLDREDASGKEVVETSFDTEARGKIVEILKGPCQSTDCGMKVQFQNTSDRIITAVVEFGFLLPDKTPRKLRQQYDLAPMEKVNMGCSNFCHGGESYVVSREVISAKYK